MRTALVSGAAKGIGRAVVERLLRDGHRVALTYLSDEAGAQATLAELAPLGPLSVHRLDVADTAACDVLVEAVGPVDVLVNNAALVQDQFVRFTRDADWLTMLDINLTGAFRLTRAVLPGMQQRGFGRVIQVGSFVGLAGAEGRAAYAAGKAGLAGFTRSLVREVGAAGVTVNTVCPGLILTERTRQYKPRVLASATAAIPLGRAGEPAEVAGLIAFLASDAAGYITGQVMPIDGGLYMREWGDA